MHSRIRANRAGSTPQSRPSTGMSPPMVPVDGDYPFESTGRLSVDESEGAATSNVVPGGRLRRIRTRRASRFHCAQLLEESR
jgi:hypothetical protein